VKNVAVKISERNAEIDTVRLASEAAARFASTLRGDIMVIALIDLQEEIYASRPGFTRMAPVVSGMFCREFLRAPVDAIKQKEVNIEGVRVTLIASSRAAYVRALDLPMLEAAFGIAIAKNICDGLRKRRGRVPVLRATQYAFCGVATVPDDGVPNATSEGSE
jgi:hypothetical protein